MIARRRIVIVGIVPLAVAAGLAWQQTSTTRHAAVPACSEVWTSGSLLGNHTVGPLCIPSGLAELCDEQTLTVGTLASVTPLVCVPDPATDAIAPASAA